MKIQGPNPLINIYKNNLGKTVKQSSDVRQKDKLDISFEAKNLQKYDTGSPERANQIAAIKQQIQNDEYKINYEQTASKLIDFFTK